jgi:hypothetical protein
MTSVDLLKPHIRRQAMPIGMIAFYVLPVQKEDDFGMLPPGILSFADVQGISVELSQNCVHGNVGRYKWEKIT